MVEELPDRLKLYRFQIDRSLGRGGTGRVYRGIDTANNQVVAIKLFYESFFRSNTHVRELTRSVEDFKKFDHPNVVHVYEFISGKEGYCLVLEYVDGPDLKWYLDNRPWNLEERLVIIAQVCNGLQYLHDHGFTHHDIKPGNILFTRKGIAKLTDYSLVRSKTFSLFDSSLHEQVTPMYIAPELLQKKKATPQSDIYSLGITLYLMFAGKLPFEADSLQRLYNYHLRAIPIHPSEVNRKCPKNLGDIIMRMLAKNPEERYDNCDQLRIVLSDIGRSRI